MVEFGHEVIVTLAKNICLYAHNTLDATLGCYT